MKTSFKPCPKGPYFAAATGLVLALSLLGIRPAAAQALTPAAATPAPAPAGTAATPPASGPATTPAAATTAPADSTPSLSDYNNWVTLGIGGTFVSGDKAQFQRQQDTKDGVFGGLQDFHWQQFVGKTGTLTVDGHAIVGNHDYDFKLDLTDPTLGYIRAGYTEFRTWYDGNGGFYPPNSESFSLYDNDLYVDRRNAWIEAGLTLPDLPAFSFRYEYDSRVGNMDSTSWGDNGTGAAPLPPDVKIVPTYLGIDETRNIFQGDVKDKLDNTDMGLTLRYELDDTKDSTYMDLDPLNAPGAAGDRLVTDYDIEKNDIFNVHGFSETFFNDKVTFSSGFSYVNVDTNLGGSRVYGPAYNASAFNPAFATAGARDSGYLALGGLGSTNEYVGNLNLMLTPIKNLVFIPAVRFEYNSSNLEDDSLLTATSPSTTTPPGATSDTWDTSVAESLEARYTGFRDWSLYASGDWSEDWGNDAWNETTAVITPILNQNWNRFCQKYTVGANWYPLPQLNFGTQYYHQIHDYDYGHELPTPATSYPGYLQKQNFTTDDMNIRATWQALSTLSLVTRYDFQYSTVDTWSIPNGGTQIGGVQSCDINSQIISENASWTPLPRLYLQAGGSYVLNTVDTPVAGSAGINNIVLNGDNDYWTANVGAGYALDDKTDLRVDYTYYRAADFADDAGGTTAATTGANSSLPYGADTEEHNVTASITRQINKSLQVSLKYGFSKYRDGTSGGQDDYESQLVYASMKYGF